MWLTDRIKQHEQRGILAWPLFGLALALPLQVLAQTGGDANKLLSVWAGTLPLILAAPHGGREPIPGVPQRRGVGVAEFTTGRDNNTDELAETIALKLG